MVMNADDGGVKLEGYEMKVMMMSVVVVAAHGDEAGEMVLIVLMAIRTMIS